jgi:hypothetical protein
MWKHPCISLLLLVALTGVACDTALPLNGATLAPTMRPSITPDSVPEALKTPTPTLLPATSAPTPTLTRGPSPTATETPTLPPPTGADCVSDPAPKLTAVITDLAMIDFIMPMVVPSSNWLKNRSYFRIKDDPSAVPGVGYEVPVYAPADAVLTGITRYAESIIDQQGVLVEQDQFDLEFRVSCEVSYGFDHVARLVGKADDVAPTVSVRDTRGAQKRVSVAYAAGDLIGYTKGTSGAHTWDFIMRNSTSEIRYANQQRYEMLGDLAKLRDAACPYDYYDEPLRLRYLALFGGWGTGAVGAEGCPGSPDVAGTISGGWFATPFIPDIDQHIADWAAVVVPGVGGMVEVNDGHRMVRMLPTDASYAVPAEVTGEHCYERMNRPPHVCVREFAVAHGNGHRHWRRPVSRNDAHCLHRRLSLNAPYRGMLRARAIERAQGGTRG